MGVAVEAKWPDESITEAELTALGDQLVLRHDYMIKATTTAMNARDGFPQRVYVKNGHMLIVEYLVARAKPSKTQQEWLDHFEAVELASTGAVTALVVQPQSWGELIKAFR